MKKLILFLFCAILISGCSLLSTQPYIQTFYFDIGSPNTDIGKNNTNIQIMTVSKSGPYRERMVFRTSPNSVRFDEFNRWSMHPTEMVKRYLTMIYNDTYQVPKNGQKLYSLNAEIVQLEGDLANNKILLALHFELYEEENDNIIWEKTFKQQIPVQKVTGESFAKAVQYGMDNIVKDLDMCLDSKIK